MRTRAGMMTMALALLVLVLLISACTPVLGLTQTTTVLLPTATTPVVALTASLESKTSTPGYESPMMPITPENTGRLVAVEVPLPALAQDLYWGAFNQLLVLCLPDVENNTALAAYALFPPAPTTSAEYPAILRLPPNLLAIPRHPIELALNNGSSVVTISLDGAPLRTLEVGGTVYGAAYAPDQQTLVIYLADRWEAQVWSLSTGEHLTTLAGFETAAPVYAIVPGLANIAWMARGTLQLQNIQTGILSPAVHYSDFITAAVFAPLEDGVLGVLVAGQLHLIHPDTATETFVLDAPGAVTLAFSPTGQIVATGGNQGILLWDVMTGGLLASLPGNVTHLSFSDDGTTLAAIQNDRLALLLWQPH